MQRLDEERNVRVGLYKKYHRGVSILIGLDTTLVSASVGMGIGGPLSTIIAAPVVLGLEIAVLACGLLGVAGKFISQRLSVKVKKHDEVRVLAESKLNTIADRVWKALADGQISDEEFPLIIDEAQKYTQMKAEIRAGAKNAHGAVTLDEETKTSLIQRCQNEARASFMKKLTGPWMAVYPGCRCVTAYALGMSTWARHRHKVSSMTHPRGAPRLGRGRGGLLVFFGWAGGPPGGWGGPYHVNHRRPGGHHQANTPLSPRHHSPTPPRSPAAHSGTSAIFQKL